MLEVDEDEESVNYLITFLQKLSYPHYQIIERIAVLLKRVSLYEYLYHTVLSLLEFRISIVHPCRHSIPIFHA